MLSDNCYSCKSVKTVMERPDLDTQEKLILIDLLMREPKPEKAVAEETGRNYVKIGMAVATDEQIAERTGISASVVKGRLRRLRERGFLLKKPSKGRVPNRYNVKFPHKAKAKQDSSDEQK